MHYERHWVAQEQQTLKTKVDVTHGCDENCAKEVRIAACFVRCTDKNGDIVVDILGTISPTTISEHKSLSGNNW